MAASADLAPAMAPESISPGSADLLRGACAPQRFRTRPLLLVIDPDPAAAGLLGSLGPGVEVRVCATAAEGLLLAGGLHPDAVLLTTDLDDLPCTRLVELLRRCCELAVIVATDGAHGQLAGAALEAGATAVIAHPYRPRELLGLLQSIRPHSVINSDPEVHCGGLSLDPAAMTVHLHGRKVDMPPQELRVLHLLMAHAGRVVSRAQIWESVWGGPMPSATNTISVHVRRLRLRLGDAPAHPSMLVTVGRSGYRLDPPPAPGAGVPGTGTGTARIG